MKKCKSGYYYCNTDKKCKPIPRGYRVGYGGYLRKEKDDDDSKTKSNGNGNGNGNGSHGNGNGGNGSNGGGNGGGMGESVIHEADFNLSDLTGSKKEYDLTNARERAMYNRLKKAGKNPLIKKVTEGSLHKWFKGSKSKDGKGGWVNVVTGGTCASDEPGEGTPKCVSSSKRASMSKSERLSAARRKKKADPGQQSKSGAAKPTYVSTDSPRKKKKMKESNDLKTIAKELDNASKMHKSQANRVRKHIKDMHKEEKQPKNCGCGKDPCITYGKKKKKKSHDCASKVEHKEYGVGNCIKEMHTLDSTGNVTHYDVMFEHGIEKNVFIGDLNVLVSEMHEHVINTDKNKELLKTEEAKSLFSTPGLDKLKKIKDYKSNADKVFKRKEVDKAHYEPEGETIEEADKKGKGSGSKDACYHKVKSRYSVWPSAYASGALVKCRKVGAANWGNSKKEEFDPSELSFQQFMEKCWKGYEKKGMKTMFGKRYPNCVKKEETVIEHHQKDKDGNTIPHEDTTPSSVEEGAAWTRKAGKNKSGGLNEKGRRSYERENPGSDLKAPSKKVGNKRRASFCARMRGMKKKLTSAKTARDPDSRINKSLRAWNC